MLSCVAMPGECASISIESEVRYVGVWIEAIDKERTRVLITGTGRSVLSRSVAPIIEEDFHDDFVRAVDITKKEERVPFVLPSEEYKGIKGF